jgi:hypothetical protein
MWGVSYRMGLDGKWGSEGTTRGRGTLLTFNFLAGNQEAEEKKALKTAISGERGAVIRGRTYRNDGPGNSHIPERWPKLEGLVAHVSRQIWSG